jgi:hypothetical protein
MPSLINKQPVFTDQIILSVYSGDVERCTANGGPEPTPITIYTTSDSNGSLIERITITATGDTVNYPNVLPKLVYMYLYDPNTGIWALYKTGTLADTTVTNTQPNPTIEWVFNGGILLPQSAAIGFLASITSFEGTRADRLAIVIEGSSYSQI